MIFTDIDKVLFTLINAQSKVFEAVVEKSLDYKLNIDQDTKKIIVHGQPGKTGFIFGLYNKRNNTYNWINGIRDIVYDHIKKHDINDIFGTDETIDKLFQDEVVIELKYKNIIPYLVAIFNKAFNLVRFEAGEVEVYGLINLGIKDTFDFDKFVESLSIYKMAYHIEKHPKKAKKNKKKGSKKTKK